MILAFALATALAQNPSGNPTPSYRAWRDSQGWRTGRSNGRAGAGRLLLEFAPASGVGMGSACACTTPTTAAGVPITFTNTTVAECPSNDGQTYTQCGVNQPRISSGTAASTVLGIWKESLRNNLALHSRDLSQAIWVKVGMTCTRTATGMRNDANGATRCTATAPNATVLQTLVTAAATRNTNLHVKTVTLAGSFQPTRDGATFTTATGLSTSLWKRVVSEEVPGCAGGNCVVLSQMTSGIANPIVGFRLTNTGDVVDIDFVQDEETETASTPIVTAGVSLSRDLDVIDLPAVVSPTAATGICVSSVGVSGGPYSAGGSAVQTVLSDGVLGTVGRGAVYAWNYTPSATAPRSAIDTAGMVSAGTASWDPMYSGFSGLATSNGFWHTGSLIKACQRDVCDVGSASTLGTPAFTRLMLGRANAAATQFSGVVKQVKLDLSGKCWPVRTGPVAWVGDSIVYGNASLPLDPATRLTELNPVRPVINGGVSSTGVASCGARYQANYTGAQTLIWSCAVNDLAAGTAGATLATAAQVFLADARSRGIKVIITEVTPWKNSTGWTLAKQTETDAYDAAMSAWAGANGAFWVATQPTMGGGGGDPDIIAVAYESAALDKIHINAAGALQFATLVSAQSP